MRIVPPSISGTPQRLSKKPRVASAGRNPEVAPEGELEPPGDGVALDGRDHGLAEDHPARTHRPVAFGIDPVRPPGIVGHRLQVRPGTERALRARQDRNVGGVVRIECPEGIGQRRRRGPVDRVAHLWPVDRDDRDGLVLLDPDAHVREPRMDGNPSRKERSHGSIRHRFRGPYRDRQVPRSDLATFPPWISVRTAIKGAVERAGIDGEQVDYVIMGQVLQAGTGQITARQAAVKAGVPTSVPAITINKVCLSGLNAIAMADQMIRAGEVSVVDRRGHGVDGPGSLSAARRRAPDTGWATARSSIR